jgi:hypothetical protein
MTGANTFSSDVYETAANQTWFSYYVDDISRQKYTGEGGKNYVLASPRSGSVMHFISIGSLGGTNNALQAGTLAGFAPAFCVQ